MSTTINSKGSPRFFWQGVLILLPIAALAATGFFTLRQDRLLAEAEARQAAQGHADVINRVLWTKLNAEPLSAGEAAFTQVFRVDRRGHLVYPPPAPSIPAPHPLDLEQLPPDDRELWRAVFRPETNAPARTNTIAAARRLTSELKITGSDGGKD